MSDQKMITIGKITKAQGNKGEVRVIPLTNHLERYQDLKSVYLVKADITLEKDLESFRFHKNFIILKFKGISDIDSALKLKDYQIQIPEEELLPLEENEYYIDDIIGFEVITNDGKIIGKVSDVIITGGTDVFLVTGVNKDYMIPAALDIITELDELEEKMIINPIPGLLEL